MLVMLVISSIFLILALYTSFLTTSCFTTSLSLLKSIETCTNLPTSNLSTLFFKLLKLVGSYFNLSISNLSTSDSILAKFRSSS